jgi:hypothetical protein
LRGQGFEDREHQPAQSTGQGLTYRTPRFPAGRRGAAGAGFRFIPVRATFRASRIFSGEIVLTVVTPATSQDLVALSAVKIALNVTDNKQDDTLERLISQASAMIATYCNRVFIQETVTETFRARHHQRFSTMHRHDGRNPFIVLQRRPIASIVSVTESEITIDPTGYDVGLKEATLERLCGDRSAYWHGTCAVNYIGGYLLADVPGDLQGATIDLVSFIKQRGTHDQTLRTVDVPGVLVTTYQNRIVTGIPDYIATVLDEHRNPSIG